MDLIPIKPDENLESFLGSVSRFPFSFVRVNNPGDHENENIVLKAEEDIQSLYEYMLVYAVEDMTTDLPDYSKCRLLTFDDLELEKGSFLQVYTRPGSDTTAISFDTIDLYKIIFWGLPEPIWHIPHSSIEIIRRGDSYSVGFEFPEP